MTDAFNSQAIAGLVASVLALALLVYLVIAPRPPRLSATRRRPNAITQPGALARGATAATSAVGVLVGGRAAGTGTALERAGVRMRAQDFLFLVGVGVVVAGALGLVLSGPVAALLLAALIPVGARLFLAFRADRRRAAFADQLDDSLQLLASSLRAGHSMLQALDSVAREAEEPTSEEFARIINETRLGREVNAALDETAARMGSEDFLWVTQAVAINREVGGNLAEVLDGVGNTIRERNEIRRQVKTLAAEGKLSAWVLMALPVGITLFLMVANPEYIGKFGESLAGYGMIVLAVVLMVVGAVWMSKVVKIKF